MPNDSQLKDMRTDREYRNARLTDVFGNETGELVLQYLESLYDFVVPDMDNVNKTFFKLGRKSVLKDIRIMLKEKPKKEQTK